MTGTLRAGLPGLRGAAEAGSAVDLRVDDATVLFHQDERPVPRGLHEAQEQSQILGPHVLRDARREGHPVDRWQRRGLLDIAPGRRRDPQRPARRGHLSALEVVPAVRAAAERTLLAALPVTCDRNATAHRAC
jgi:hypothetical protein